MNHKKKLFHKRFLKIKNIRQEKMNILLMKAQIAMANAFAEDLKKLIGEIVTTPITSNISYRDVLIAEEKVRYEKSLHNLYRYKFEPTYKPNISSYEEFKHQYMCAFLPEEAENKNDI